MFQKGKKAFTLIELLIVITIIGILAVALLPKITAGPAKARDAQRKADLTQIATALEFYADGHNGLYPTSTGTCLDNTTGTVGDSLNDYLGGTISTDPSISNAIGSVCLSTDAGKYWYRSVTVGGVSDAGYILVADTEMDGEGKGYYDLSDTTNVTSVTSLEDFNLLPNVSSSGTSPNPAEGENNVYALGR